MLDLVKRDVKLLQILDQDNAIGDPIDVVMAEIEELQVVESGEVSAVYLLELVVADVDPAYALTEEEIGEAGYVVVAEIYTGQLDHLREKVFMGLIRDDEVIAEIYALKAVQVYEFFAKAGYPIAGH